MTEPYDYVWDNDLLNKNKSKIRLFYKNELFQNKQWKLLRTYYCLDDFRHLIQNEGNRDNKTND